MAVRLLAPSIKGTCQSHLAEIVAPWTSIQSFPDLFKKYDKLAVEGDQDWDRTFEPPPAIMLAHEAAANTQEANDGGTVVRNLTVTKAPARERAP